MAGAAEPATFSGFFRAIPIVADVCAQQQVGRRSKVVVLCVLCERRDAGWESPFHGHGSIFLYFTRRQTIAELHDLIDSNPVPKAFDWLAPEVTSLPTSCDRWDTS